MERYFVPRRYDNMLKSTEANQKIDFGVGVYYDMLEMKWFCRIYPKKDSPLEIKSLKALGSKKRVFVSNNTWEMRGGQLTPKYIGFFFFLTKQWNNYDPK